MPTASAGGLFHIRVARMIDATGVGNVPIAAGKLNDIPGNVIVKNSDVGVQTAGMKQPVSIRSTEFLQ